MPFKKNLLTTPVLFCIYNDPEITFRSFQKIKEVRPKKLFISADGPNKNKHNDELNCKKTRAIINQITWPCKTSFKFASCNLGLKTAMTSAINWFFSENTEGIILEHDCYAHRDFFFFCQKMLEKYKNNTSVLSISGNNLQDGHWVGDGDYYFSNLFGCWGWATWSRAWKLWSPTLRNYKYFKEFNYLYKLGFSKKNRKNMYSSLDSICNGQNKTTWSFNFEYAQICSRGLTIVPNVNLVANIGFGKNATNAKEASSHLANMRTYPLPRLNEPKFILADIQADNRQLDFVYKERLSIKIKNLCRKSLKNILPAALIKKLKQWLP